MKINRRHFTKSAAAAGLFAAAAPLSLGSGSAAPLSDQSKPLKLSLNAYSFDKPLRSGVMTIDDLLDFCAASGFDGADLTGYYFPGYPVPPADEYIFHVKQKAFRLGIDLGCTGVRNDFTWPDPEKRAGEKKLVKEWVVVASKLGAPALRIFAGNLSKEDYSWDDRAGWIAADIAECAEFAAKYGVILALQNHYDFLKTPEQVLRMLGLVNHKWVGLMLDIGSYHSPDPYRDIEKTAGYAVTWQIKENVYRGDKEEETDFIRLSGIIKASGYSGYLPLETLGEGDPYLKIKALLVKVRRTL
jgi:sugar phosphate isomerase/epimerase